MAASVAKPRAKKSPSLRQKVERSGPSLAKLKQLAKTHRPPQKWYDDTTNPFKSK